MSEHSFTVSERPFSRNLTISGHLNGLAWDPEMDLWYYTSKNSDAETVSTLIAALRQEIDLAQGVAIDNRDVALKGCEHLARIWEIAESFSAIAAEEAEFAKTCHGPRLAGQIDEHYHLMAQEVRRIQLTADLIIADVRAAFPYRPAQDG
ncbi:hypothetical protein ACIQWN_37060 [Streptomyces vinaceus]|uniref:hypothetical protein n=1 Tax=Streptomyces vinaceus TaxID=1960 RepID=UPI00381F3E32